MIANVGLFDHSNGFDAGRLLAEVPQAERERYRALARPRQAARYLASRWLLRTHLASELGVGPIDVPLQHAAGGPPTLQGMRYYLSLSHSDALCLCIASTRVRVGCDAERHRPRRRMHEIATRFFHPREAACLNTLDKERATVDFYRLWTLKEAGRKARGHGIGGDLPAPAFTPPPAFRCLQPIDGSPSTYAVGTYGPPSEQYSLALALNAPHHPDLFTAYRYAPGPESASKHLLAIDWHVAAAG